MCGLRPGPGVLVTARETYTRALALEASGNDAAALTLLWQAAGAAPRDAEVQNRLGEALVRLGALDAAVQAFDQALAARPGFTKAANNLVLTLVQAGRGGDAVQRARRFIAEAPADPDRVFTLGLALADQDVEEAIRTFRRVLDRDPAHSRARYNLALVLQRTDRLAEAANELQRAIDTDPRAEAYYSLGIVRWHQGDLDRATGALRAAIQADPAYASAHEALGGVLRDQRGLGGGPERAAAGHRVAAGSAVGYFALARVLQSAGQEAEARRAIEDGERLRRRAQLEHEALVWTAVGTGRWMRGTSWGPWTASAAPPRRSRPMLRPLSNRANAPTPRAARCGTRGLRPSAAAQSQPDPATHLNPDSSFTVKVDGS